MRFLFLALSLFLSANILLAQKNSPVYSRVKIYLSETNNIQKLSTLGIETDHGEFAKNKHFIGEMSTLQLQTVRAAGFQTEVLITDLTAHFLAQNKKNTSAERNGNCPTAAPPPNIFVPTHFQLGSMGGYLKYQEMLDNLDQMAALYPNLITVKKPISTTNLTFEGRKMFWVKISDNPNLSEPTEPQILYDAVHHAREPESMSQLIYYMWYLLERYNSDPEVKYLVNNLEMYFVPCVNPDGYIYNETTNPDGGGFWRKNRRINADSVVGVDLNRNYGYEWGFDNIGSSTATNSEVYRGTAGFSEPETQNMRDFCNAHKFQFALNYHTYGNLLIYPWGFSDSLTPDSTSFTNFSKVMTRDNKWVFGTGSQTVNYTTNGDSDDWMYGENVTKAKIFSLTPEVGPGATGFWPPSADIIPLSHAALSTNLTTAHLPLQYALVKYKNTDEIDTFAGKIPFTFTRYGLLGGNFIVNIAAKTTNIQNIQPSSKQYIAPVQFLELKDSFTFSLQPNIQNGDTVKFTISVSNGFYTHTDTLVKIFKKKIQFSVAFADAANNLNQWKNDPTPPSWAVTNTTFYSAPSSITDSPAGDYQDGTESSLTTKNPISLLGKNSAKLTFWAKWDIETDYDFVEVMASTNGTTFVPLCGKYTVAGTSDQDLDQPLYEGTQTEWVKEEIDLADYLGGNLWIRFRIKSDAGLTKDGFYFDDLSVVTSIPTATTDLDASDFVAAHTQPNPADDFARISWKNNLSTHNTRLLVFNSLGQPLFERALDDTAASQTLDIQTSKWANGIYFYKFLTEKESSKTYRFVVHH